MSDQQLFLPGFESGNVNQYGYAIEPKPDAAKARTSDPETSHDAAAQVDVTARESQVLAAVKRYAKGMPFTTWSLAVACDPLEFDCHYRTSTDKIHSIIHKRMAGLETKGKLNRLNTVTDIDGARRLQWRLNDGN